MRGRGLSLTAVLCPLALVLLSSDPFSPMPRWRPHHSLAVTHGAAHDLGFSQLPPFHGLLRMDRSPMSSWETEWAEAAVSVFFSVPPCHAHSLPDPNIGLSSPTKRFHVEWRSLEAVELITGLLVCFYMRGKVIMKFNWIKLNEILRPEKGLYLNSSRLSRTCIFFTPGSFKT